MTKHDRAPRRVAKYLLREYGYHEAVAIVSLRLKARPQKVDIEFWLDVLGLVEVLWAEEYSESSYPARIRTANRGIEVPYD